MTPERQQRIELIRWLVLKTAGVGGHLGVTETMVSLVMDNEQATTKASLRDEIHYLESRKLIDVQRHDVKPWRINLSRHGRDIVDYQVDCEPGIARPKLPIDWVK